MKSVLKITLVLVVMVLFGCRKGDSSSPVTFKEKVKEITGSKQFKPALTNFVNIEWTCTDWKLSFYNSIGMVGEWNAYKNTILDEEKNQIYKFDNDKLNVLKLQNISGVLQDVSQKITSYTWDNTGVLSINGINYIVKMQDDKLYLYYNTKDIVKVGESFNVTVDNTYGHSLEQEGGVIGVGLIQFTKKVKTTIDQQATDNILSLITKFIAKDDILNQKFATIETSSINHTYVLSNGSDNLKYNVNLTDHQVDLTTLAPARAKLLFKAFVTKTAFNFKGVDIILNKIEHEDEGSSSFFVTGAINGTSEVVKFYYNTQSTIEYWAIFPGGNKSIDISMLLGIWRRDFFGSTPIGNADMIKREYKANQTIEIYNSGSRVRYFGTWSVSANKTVLTSVFTKYTDMKTGVTTTYNSREEGEIVSITNTKFIVFATDKYLGTKKAIHTRL